MLRGDSKRVIAYLVARLWHLRLRQGTELADCSGEGLRFWTDKL
ncbi:unnamed protein product [Mycena citricolor]|uniref:Uncharacterized protein n=1 Tax=Mycena citricolor TaxID=2018698 RepID=A0AAD2K3A3_9AGAR|nr:unnamed protein product [Mycena citricolor]CAK5276579.1 unnamed protein product [Mycena citricolor]